MIERTVLFVYKRRHYLKAFVLFGLAVYIMMSSMIQINVIADMSITDPQAIQAINWYYQGLAALALLLALWTICLIAWPFYKPIVDGGLPYK